MVAAARREEKLKELVDEIESAGGQAVGVVADVSKVCLCVRVFGAAEYTPLHTYAPLYTVGMKRKS